ncbi:MAG: aldose epimerase family protein [Butyricicoccaceae bacterium]
MITKSYFGTTHNGDIVTRYTLTNQNGITVHMLDYGCIIQSVIVSDRNGVPLDVVLGYDTLAGYEQGTAFHGALIGRYANRIGESRFTLNGKTYELEPNEGKNHLHGVYATSMFQVETHENNIVFHRTSLDGEEGYPGQIELTVTYTLTDENELILDYQAVSDADTVINLTNHSYFNLDGHNSGSVADHMLSIRASQFTLVQPDAIPTGELRTVEHTPFDFRTAKPIGQDMERDDSQLRLLGGYDHNFVLDSADLSKPAAVAWSSQSGIQMECLTTQPGIQFYHANHLHEDAAMDKVKQGAVYKRWGAFCLETQHFPDSPNQSHFPSAILRKGEHWHETTVYRFSIRD